MTIPPFLWCQITISLATIGGTTNAFSSTHPSLANNYPPSSLSSPPPLSRRRSLTSLNLFQTQIFNRHFQLEELEDAETATTDILLNEDNTVTVGRTDGPLYREARGTWAECFEDKRSEGGLDRRMFSMTLTRRYLSGSEGKDQTDIGEFEYEVERTYLGEVTLVGGSLLAMNGEIYDVDEIFGERKLGFFNMIDTTEARKSDSVEK